MEQNDIHLGTARLHFSQLYHSEHYSCYMFDLKFEQASTLLFDPLCFVSAGADMDLAKEFLAAVKQYFETAGIHEGSRIAILFAGSQILAISAVENDLWIDVHEGVSLDIPPKYFGSLGVTVASLTVH